MKLDEIVCGCENVTYGEIKKAIEHGAKSLEDVQDITKAGTGCGECVNDLTAIVNELLKQQR